jgi:hypothetical protein
MPLVLAFWFGIGLLALRFPAVLLPCFLVLLVVRRADRSRGHGYFEG